MGVVVVVVVVVVAVVVGLWVFVVVCALWLLLWCCFGGFFRLDGGVLGSGLGCCFGGGCIVVVCGGCGDVLWCCSVVVALVVLFVWGYVVS